MAAASVPLAPALAAHTDRIELIDPVFISDLHLSPLTPATVARFERFCAHEVHGAELLILGDLFEAWLGDDDIEDDTGRRVGAALAGLTARGVRPYLMQGNRDLLLARAFCERAGATLLADPTQARIGGQTVLLAHGDAWCTQDVEYMQFRAQVRNPMFQLGFLGQPLAERRAFVRSARMASQTATQAKSMDIMDVTPAEVDAALRASGVDALIHGHTHRPAEHRHDIDGRAVTRWVLPDWDFDTPVPRGGCLRVHAGRWQVVPLAP